MWGWMWAQGRIGGRENEEDVPVDVLREEFRGRCACG